MANLTEADIFPAGIYQIETNDPVVGGIPNEATGAGMSNIPHQQLAKRTNWLKARVETLLAANPSVLSANGWTRFQSGLILQWGICTLPASGATTSAVMVTLPIAFPTAFLTAAGGATRGANTGSGGLPAVGIISGALTQFELSADLLLYTTFNQTVPCRWHAIGY
jgi:hypothetical protein